MTKFIEARFTSKCFETGITINKHDNILYNPVTKRAYCSESKKYKQEAEQQSIASHIQAQEDACFDNFCINNTI